MLVRRDTLPGIKTLVVHSGHRYEIRQAHRLENGVDWLGLGINVTCIETPEMTDDEQWDPEPDGEGESWDWTSKDN